MSEQVFLKKKNDKIDYTTANSTFTNSGTVYVPLQQNDDGSGSNPTKEGEIYVGDILVGKGLRNIQDASGSEPGGANEGSIILNDISTNKSDGMYNLVEGSENEVVSSNGIHIEGVQNSASNLFISHIEGNSNFTNSSYSHIEGNLNTLINSDYSHVEGAENDVTSSDPNFPYSHVEGYKNTVEGSNAHVEGNENLVQESIASHIEGYLNTIGQYAENAHAEGYLTIAKGISSHTEGTGDITEFGEVVPVYAEGEGSHAEGYATSAIEKYSHAEGGVTRAVGRYAHAEGYTSTAEGWESHAEGDETYAKGHASHTSGLSTIAEYNRQFVLGEYNDNKEEDLFEIGAGVYGSRKNVTRVVADRDSSKVLLGTGDQYWAYKNSLGNFAENHIGQTDITDIVHDDASTGFVADHSITEALKDIDDKYVRHEDLGTGITPADILLKPDVVDTLSSTSKTTPLSANMGRELKEEIGHVDITNIVQNVVDNNSLTEVVKYLSTMPEMKTWRGRSTGGGWTGGAATHPAFEMAFRFHNGVTVLVTKRTFAGGITSQAGSLYFANMDNYATRTKYPVKFSEKPTELVTGGGGQISSTDTTNAWVWAYEESTPEYYARYYCGRGTAAGSGIDIKKFIVNHITIGFTTREEWDKA